jgi:hypothetical protein
MPPGPVVDALMQEVAKVFSWLPIEAAPKDGGVVAVLGRRPSGHPAYGTGVCARFGVVLHGNWDDEIVVTHVAALPDLPSPPAHKATAQPATAATSNPEPSGQ